MSSKLVRLTTPILSLFLLASILIPLTPLAKADETTITDNGSGSSNQVTQTSNSHLVVQQSNQASLENQTSSSTNTGSNQASSNTAGATQIDSGNSQSTTSTSNTLNSSTVQNNCCSSPTNQPSENSIFVISQNGPSSTNQTDLNHDQTTTVTVTQTATITTHIQGSSNTGSNIANNNSGNTSIITGNIQASNQIDNAYINQSKSQANSPQTSTQIKIFGNGPDSQNFGQATNNNQTHLSYVSSAYINNFLNFLANTGSNQASNNNGIVLIRTGDILLDNYVFNRGINSGLVQVSCHCLIAQAPAPTPPPTAPNQAPTAGTPPTPTNNTLSSPGSSSSDGDSGSTLGATIGNLLPATGNNGLLNTTLACIELILIGLFLRSNPKRLNRLLSSIKTPPLPLTFLQLSL